MPRRNRPLARALAALWISCAAACSDPSVAPDASRADGGHEAGALDGGSDGGADAGVDARSPGDDAGDDAAAPDAGDCSSAEACDGADDDCDGRVDEDPVGCGVGERCEAGACGAPSWMWETALGASDVTVHDVGVDVAGNLYVVGWTTAAFALGGTAITPGPFLASFDSAGALRWARGFGGGGYSFAVAVSDRVHVLTETRFYAGTAIDFGGGARTVPAGNSGCHVAAFEHDGAYVADREVSRGSLLACRSLAVRGSTVVVTRAAAGMGSHLLVLDASLAERWRRALPDDVRAELTSADVTDAGGVIAGGHHDDPVDLGLGSLTPRSRSAFAVAYDATGAPQWQRHFDTERSEYVARLVTTADGPVVLLGGAGPDPADASVVALDPGGADRFTRSLGVLFANDLAVGPDGRIGVAVETIGSVDLGGGPRPASTGFLLTLDRAGTYRWDIAAGRSARGVAFDAARWVVVGASDDGAAPGWIGALAD